MIYKFLLAVVFANEPVFVAETLVEYNSLGDCIKAIQLVEPKNLQQQLVCVAVPINYI